MRPNLLLAVAPLALILSSPVWGGSLSFEAPPFGLPDGAPPFGLPDSAPPADRPTPPPIDLPTPPTPPVAAVVPPLDVPDGAPPVDVPEPPRTRPDVTPPFGLPDEAPPTGAPPGGLPGPTPAFGLAGAEGFYPAASSDGRAVTFERTDEDIWISIQHPRLGEIAGIGDPFLTVHVTPGSGEPPVIEGPIVPAPHDPEARHIHEAVAAASDGAEVLAAGGFTALLAASQPASVPEPSLVLLLGSGLAWLAWRRRGL